VIALLLACAGPAPDTAGAPLQAAVALAGEDRVVEVGVPLDLSAGDSVGVSFAWSFGDGEEGEGSLVSHAWDAPGRYTVVLSALGEDGVVRTDALVVAVHLPLAAVPPVASSTILVTGEADDWLAWVVNPEAGSVSWVDAEGRSDELALTDCAGPRTLGAAGGTLAVACEQSDALVLVSIENLREAGRVELPAGAAPYGVAGRDGSFWVSLPGLGELGRVQGETLARFPVGPDPRGVALLADGRVAATRFRSPASGAELYLLDPDTGAVETLVLLPDEGGDSDTTTGGVPNLLEQAVPTPDGVRLFLPMLHSNVLRGAYVSGAALDHQTSLRAVLGVVDLDLGAEDAAFRKQFDERGRASAAVPSPHGDLLYVLDPGVGAVMVVDAWNGNLAGSILGVGTGPAGLASSPDGELLLVDAWLDRAVRAYPVDALSAGSPEPAWTVTRSAEVLSEEELLGKRVFHDASDPRMTKSGYVACAHCHPDGRQDGQTWDFTDRGEGLRNTSSLQGRGGTAMGPLHWTANFDEVQDFEHDIRGPFAGTGFLSEADWEECGETLGAPKAGRSAELDALAAYLETIPLPRAPSAGDDRSAGEAAFAAAGCAECHPAPLYTDSSLVAPLRHDVGTLTVASGSRKGAALDGLDTPTLLGTWDTGPWLHDGSAATLEAAIRAHDGATGLDDATVAAIAAFVAGL
jgi:hypothetical protein